MSETAFPKLTRPPLREALIDLRLSESLPVSLVERWKKFNKEGFVNPIVMKQGGFKFEIGKDSPAQASVTSDESFGVRYERNNGAEVLQFRRNGVTLSILKNYTTWEALRTATENAWKQFLEISGPVKISRLAVRYINVLELPPGEDYDEYLTAGPRIPKPLPQIANGFLQRVLVPFAKADALAIITQTMETTSNGSIQAVLDIDVFSECSLDGTSVEIWSRLENFRVIKNDIFFSSLTEKVLNSYR